MSQGPLGLVAGTLCAVPACCAIASVAPVTVSASASIGARLILIFMVGVGPLRVRDQISLKLAAGIRIPLVLKGFRAVSGVCLRKRILCFDHVHGMAAFSRKIDWLPGPVTAHLRIGAVAPVPFVTLRCVVSFPESLQ